MRKPKKKKKILKVRAKEDPSWSITGEYNQVTDSILSFLMVKANEEKASKNEGKGTEDKQPDLNDYFKITGQTISTNVCLLKTHRCTLTKTFPSHVSLSEEYPAAFSGRKASRL